MILPQACPVKVDPAAPTPPHTTRARYPIEHDPGGNNNLKLRFPSRHTGESGERRFLTGHRLLNQPPSYVTQQTQLVVSQTCIWIRVGTME
ncbi:hypothetical protein VTH06DRAFT_5862 [Thermothelomyces fergusii]